MAEASSCVITDVIRLHQSQTAKSADIFSSAVQRIV
jgi:hypothetical protein